MLKFGKQSFLKQKWKWFLKSSSLFVRIIVLTIVLIKNTLAIYSITPTLS